MRKMVPNADQTIRLRPMGGAAADSYENGITELNGVQGRDRTIRLRSASYGGTSLCSASPVLWCPGAGSNHRHCDFQSHALPTELPGHCGAETARSGRFIVGSDGA